LRPKLAHVRYGSREFDQVLKRTLPKYQVGGDRSEAIFQWRVNFGPTPIRIAQIQLELTALNTDDSWDDANFAFWPSRTGTDVQFLDGFNEFEDIDPSSILASQEFRDGDRLIRCGAATRAGNRSWPGARTYRLRDGRWGIVKTEERENPSEVPPSCEGLGTSTDPRSLPRPGICRNTSWRRCRAGVETTDRPGMSRISF